MEIQLFSIEWKRLRIGVGQGNIPGKYSPIRCQPIFDFRFIFGNVTILWEK